MFNMIQQSSTIPFMLKDIKKSCGIFLSNTQYTQIIELHEHSINVLWKNRDNLKQFLLYHDSLFNKLMQLSPDNLKAFFEIAKISPCGDAEDVLNALLRKQSFCPPVVVVQDPQFYPIPPVHHHPAPPPYSQSIPPVHHHPMPLPTVHHHPIPTIVQAPCFFTKPAEVHHHESGTGVQISRNKV